MKLSIITINYNNKAGLQKTIDSIICQTWKDYEWIVIDGGSTDGSKELIEKYQQHFAYWCSEPDKGVYNAMNKGIAKAKGDYLNFMNSGDCLASRNVLQNIFFMDYDDDILVGNVIRGDNHQKLNKYDENIVRQLLVDTIQHQATFINRKLFDNYKYNEEYTISADWVAWIEWILINNHSYRYLDCVVNIQEMGGISSNRLQLRAERKRALQNLFGKRLAEELPLIYRTQKFSKDELALRADILQLQEKQNKMSGEFQIPAIKGLRYLQSVCPLCFSLFYRLIMTTVKIHDFFSKTSSLKDFEKSNAVEG